MSQPDPTSPTPLDLKRDLLAPFATGDMSRAAAALADNLLLILPGVRPIHGKASAVRFLRQSRRRVRELEFIRVAAHRAAPGWLMSTWSIEATGLDGDPVRAAVDIVARLDLDGRIAYLSEDVAARRASVEVQPGSGETTTPFQVDGVAPLRSF